METKYNTDEQNINIKRGGRSLFISVIICLAVFLGAIVLLIVAFNRLISRHDQRLSAEICNIMSEKMNSSIEYLTESADVMASVLSAQAFESPNEIYDTIKKNSDSDPDSDFLSAGFIDESGHKYATPEEAAEFDKWELLKTAELADPVSMSAPYRSSVYGQPVVTLFTNFRYGDQHQGYMFVTYKFTELQKIAATQSLENDIEIWLMNADSANVIQCAGSDIHTIGSWTNAYLTMQEVNSDDIPIYKDWLERVRRLEDNIGITYSVNETIYSQQCAKIKCMPGWYVVVRIPSNALSATMHTFRNYVLSFLAVLLIVMIVLIANMYRMSKRENEILEQLSTHDPLTGVLNRRALDHAARKWLSHGRDCALLFFDLDYFKQVNDRFGHNVGDKLLVSFSDTLKRAFSDSGIISRFGGDEFVVVTDMENVEFVNSRIRMIQTSIRAFDPAEGHDSETSYSFSFSSGAARFPQDANDLSLLMKLADIALYDVKERGRDGFMWYSELSKNGK